MARSSSHSAHLVVIILCIATATALASNVSIGTTYWFDVSRSSPVSLRFLLNSSSTDLQAIRVLTSSENATTRHPVLVTVRQPMGVVSWVLPYVESGYAYSSVERTLCPLLNRDDDEPAVLLIDLSTSQSTPLSVSLATTLVQPFKLTLNEPMTLSATPSGPAYLLYEYEAPPTDSHVRVRFQSSDNTSDICAIASIQTAYCPVVELLDNPDHRGRYQTMRSIASINTRNNVTDSHFGFFYVVVTVFPSDGSGGGCVFSEGGQGDELIRLDDSDDNYNPTPFSAGNRTKTVTITVEPEIPASQYVVAAVVPSVVYIFFIVFAVIWIILSENIWYKKSRTFKLMRQLVHSENGEDQQEKTPGCDCSSKPNIFYVLLGRQKFQTAEVQVPLEEHQGGNGSIDLPEQCSVSRTESREQEMSKFETNIHMAQLGEFDDCSTAQKAYTSYCWYLLVIVVFYSIPAYQLVVTYQRLLTTSGNEDICYYNSLCARPVLLTSTFTLSAFNNIFSNIGFILLGLLFIYTAYRRRNIYRWFESHNKILPYWEKIGVPPTYGIFYSFGLVMIAQAFMSMAYHLCPNSSNYQFDATSMYVMAVLGMYKILKSRCPDLSPSLSLKAILLMTILIVVVLGGILMEYLAFKIVFILLYILTTLLLCVEFYYRWQLKGWKDIRELCSFCKKEHFCPPKHPCKLVVVIATLFFNTVIATGIFLAEFFGIDFARYFVLVVLANFLIYLIYYWVAKCIYRESFSFKPFFYLVLAVVAWIASIYFFTRDVTDWSVSPALSRDKNAECTVLEFYDSHDLWHFLSSFALFFSFLILLTLDDGMDGKRRDNIKVF